MKTTFATGRVPYRFALCASTVTIAMLGATGAYAQCEPEPTEQNGTTTCTGTDADGVVVTARGTTVNVEDGAVVQPSLGPAIDITLTDDYSAYTWINVDGRVTGVGYAGVRALGQPLSGYSRREVNPILAIGAGGSITGAYAVLVGSDPTDADSTVRASIDNAGTLTGSSGIALYSTDPRRSGFS